MKKMNIVLGAVTCCLAVFYISVWAAPLSEAEEIQLLKKIESGLSHKGGVSKTKADIIQICLPGNEIMHSEREVYDVVNLLALEEDINVISVQQLIIKFPVLMDKLRRKAVPNSGLLAIYDNLAYGCGLPVEEKQKERIKVSIIENCAKEAEANKIAVDIRDLSHLPDGADMARVIVSKSALAVHEKNPRLFVAICRLSHSADEIEFLVSDFTSHVCSEKSDYSALLELYRKDKQKFKALLVMGEQALKEKKTLGHNEGMVFISELSARYDQNPDKYNYLASRAAQILYKENIVDYEKLCAIYDKVGQKDCEIIVAIDLEHVREQILDSVVKK